MSDDNLLLKAKKDYRESEGRYAQIVKNSLDMIFTTDKDGVFLFLSPSFEQVMGYEITRMRSRNFREFVHPEDVLLCEKYFNEVVRTGQAKYGPEYRVSHAAGSWRWHTVSGSAVQDSTGAFLYFIGVARDITGRKQVEEALLTSYRRMEKLYRERTREMLALVREQEREIRQRKLIEAELESTQKHLRETAFNLQSAAEEERLSTVTEIHNDIGHIVTSLQADLARLAGQVNAGGTTVSDEIEKMRTNLQEMDNRVNALLPSPDPPKVDEPAPDARGDKPLHETLSSNEYRVMKDIIRGKRVKQIAYEMGISPSTASTYRGRLLEKLKISSDADLVRYGMQHGIPA
jgi:PAS domain S-box-containing protein